MTCLLAAAAAAGTSDLHRGDSAPPFVLPSTEGREVDVAALRGHVVILLFGRTGHDRTRVAMEHVAAALDAPDLADEPVRLLLILSSQSRLDDLESLGRPGRVEPVILHDVDRAAFRAYEVVALPSIVVVDRDGRVAHTMTGLTNRWGDIVHDAALFAAGRMDLARFEETIHPTHDAARSEKEIRAQRLLHLADKLRHTGMPEMAESTYREALSIDPACVAARLRLGSMLARRGELDEAEELVAAALALEPDSIEATCGLAHVLIIRGGESDLVRGEELIDLALARDGSVARARYLKGLARQKHGDWVAAAESFRLAAELLEQELERQGIEKAAEVGGRPTP